MHTDDDLLDYAVEARKFSKYPPQHRATCLRLGMISEVGELVGVFDKHARKCQDSPWSAVTCDVCRPKLIDEASDVKWYAVALLHAQWGELLQTFETPFDIDESAKWHALMLVDLGFRVPEESLRHVHSIAALCGVSPKQLSDYNIAKLTARQEG